MVRAVRCIGKDEAPRGALRGIALERCPLVATLLLCACASVHEEPLRSLSAAPADPELESPRLWAHASEIDHPPLPPLKADLSDGLSPDEAAVLAVLLDPQLVAARSEHDIGKAQLLDAGVLPNPVFSLAIDHPFGSGSAGATNKGDLSLSIESRALISRGARRAAAQASLEQIDLGIAWQEWQVAEQARLLTVRLGWLRRRLQLSRDELAFAQKTTSALEVASAAGDTTLEQVGVARASLESVRRTVNELEQEEVGTEGDLLALLGEPGRKRIEVSEPSAEAGTAGAVMWDACLPQRLDLLALQRGYHAEQERVRQFVLEQFPNVTAGVHYERNESALHFIGGFVSFELPVFDRNQGNVAIGRASRTQLRRDYDARVASARADLSRLSQLAALLRRQLPEVHASIAPLEAIEQAERDAVSRGDVDRLSYQTVREALLEQRLQEANISQALAETEVGLHATCGGPLPSQADGRSQ